MFYNFVQGLMLYSDGNYCILSETVQWRPNSHVQVSMGIYHTLKWRTAFFLPRKWQVVLWLQRSWVCSGNFCFLGLLLMSVISLWTRGKEEKNKTGRAAAAGINISNQITLWSHLNSTWQASPAFPLGVRWQHVHVRRGGAVLHCLTLISSSRTATLCLRVCVHVIFLAFWMCSASAFRLAICP